MRLTALTAGDQGVRAAFAVSYGQLAPTTAMVFRRCALLAHTDFGVAAAAAPADLPDAATVAALEELVDAGLLLTAGERYRFHDLVRLFAEERVETDEAASAVAAAREQMVSALLERTVAAAAAFAPPDDPGDGDVGAARAWLDIESAHWRDALELAARQGRHRAVVRVVRALHWYSDVTAHRQPWPAVFRLGVASARAAGDTQSEAVLLNFLGWAVSYCQERPADALPIVDQALSLAARIGDRREQAWALAYRAVALIRTGAPQAAVAPARRAAELFDHIGYRVGATSARNVLATAYTELGDCAGALELHRQVLERYRGAGGSSAPSRAVAQAVTLINIGRARAGLGHWEAAAQAFAEAGELFARVGDEFGEGRAGYHLALAHRGLGYEAAATAGLLRALERFVAVNSSAWAERVRAALVRPAGTSTGRCSSAG